jgi:hypothetical protein
MRNSFVPAVVDGLRIGPPSRVRLSKTGSSSAKAVLESWNRANAQLKIKNQNKQISVSM